MKNQQILGDHKQIGKKYIPPLMSFFGDTFQETSWIKEGIPELVWIAILNRKFGIKLGAELCLSISKSAKSATTKQIWYGKMSSYSSLSSIEQKEIINLLRASHKLPLIEEALTPFNKLYPKSPLSFLTKTRSLPKSELKMYLKELKDTIAPLYDKTSIEVTFTQASGIYIAFVTELLQVSRGTGLANFPEIENYPNTEESKKIASFVRASINGFIGGLPNENVELSKGWQGYFWNKGLQIDACEVRI